MPSIKQREWPQEGRPTILGMDLSFSRCERKSHSQVIQYGVVLKKSSETNIISVYLLVSFQIIDEKCDYLANFRELDSQYSNFND